MAHGHHDHSDEASTIASRQALADARVPLSYRDQCGGILIPLNDCRRETAFAPWKCQDLRHAYEKCQYDEWKKRCQILKESKKAAK
ncbi:hypothetical protein H257_00247 [Aphanomyces astaci]|uniref:NADH dehydrogenase [ubiquinone] 1 beta subcomplex subunit 7 n=1 Tax=Aphanomyces astaci TaxID=112090 RepID=W4HC91_APHAT|nr:hypothetical protein H257_00247 [Aphanomyces astaci]ETV88733.1 hypothetical protein H257_00247 [Aphanomyces astaci]|eukprot:XP_009821133.1 hypothetical protein H257_00247 [Aphanomyces astaci]